MPGATCLLCPPPPAGRWSGCSAAAPAGSWDRAPGRRRAAPESAEGPQPEPGRALGTLTSWTCCPRAPDLRPPPPLLGLAPAAAALALQRQRACGRLLSPGSTQGPPRAVTSAAGLPCGQTEGGPTRSHSDGPWSHFSAADPFPLILREKRTGRLPRTTRPGPTAARAPGQGAPLVGSSDAGRAEQGHRLRGHVAQSARRARCPLSPAPMLPLPRSCPPGNSWSTECDRHLGSRGPCGKVTAKASHRAPRRPHDLQPPRLLALWGPTWPRRVPWAGPRRVRRARAQRGSWTVTETQCGRRLLFGCKIPGTFHHKNPHFCT